LLNFKKKIVSSLLFADSYSLTTQNIIWSYFLQTTLKVYASIFLRVLLFKTAFLHLLLLLIMVEKLRSFFYLHNYVHWFPVATTHKQAKQLRFKSPHQTWRQATKVQTSCVELS
jgi:nicotinic acid phosphoribosyltransferase